MFSYVYVVFSTLVVDVVTHEKGKVKIIKERGLNPVIIICGTNSLDKKFHVRHFVQRETSFTLKVWENEIAITIDFHDLTTEDCLY
jgi:hypothetical protein